MSASDTRVSRTACSNGNRRREQWEIAFPAVVLRGPQHRRPAHLVAGRLLPRRAIRPHARRIGPARREDGLPQRRPHPWVEQFVRRQLIGVEEHMVGFGTQQSAVQPGDQLDGGALRKAESGPQLRALGVQFGQALLLPQQLKSTFGHAPRHYVGCSRSQRLP
ncbi:hypothetical protein ACQEVG_29730 [Streptomyces sp. CA-135486]|uniref:hypothetical protein n=1 Tax=Streptomyces sp. CA-135486 TaxID=3240049 RepID=UPI003D8A465D